MRILALETTSERGSVAIVEGDNWATGKVRGYASHCEPGQQAERLLGMVEEVLVQAELKVQDVERIAVGVGPGSFTGARIGIAQAQGMALGLGIEGIGVSSLRILAAGLGCSDPRIRVIVRDAKRMEYFYGAYGPEGEEIVAPQTIPQSGMIERVKEQFAERDFVLIGEPLAGLPHFVDSWTRAPDARALGRLALDLEPKDNPLVPQYLRGPVVVRPTLPMSPLEGPREG